MSGQKYSEQKRINGAAYQANIIIDYFNLRVRVVEYRGNLISLLEEVHQIAIHHSFEKIICMAKYEDLCDFMARGFMIEAIIQKYFNALDDINIHW